MGKKFWVGFVAVYVVMMITNFVIHGGLLDGLYRSDAMAGMVRTDMDAMLWVHFVTTLVAAFFFTLIFSKGYNGTGVGEGMRFGFYVGMLVAVPMAYDTYASMPIPYSLALQWFIYGVIQYIILGIVVAAVYGKGSGVTAMASREMQAASA